MFASYPHFPSIGKIEWKVFDPERWVPEYPNPAFLNRLPDDEFWGAKLVTAFSDEDIRAIVSMGQLSDKKAEDWLVECLIKRRDKVGQVYFSKVLPLDKFALQNGEIAWEDLGAGAAPSVRGCEPAVVVLRQPRAAPARPSRDRCRSAFRRFPTGIRA